MKIIQVVHAFPPDVGGIEAHVFNLSKELVKKGHVVTVVTTRAKFRKNLTALEFADSNPKAKKTTKEPELGARGGLDEPGSGVPGGSSGKPRQEFVDGVRVIRHWSLSLPMFSSVKFVPLLPLRLAMMDADIYHSHGYGPTQPFFASIAAFLKRKPFVFTLHGYPKLKGLGGVAVWFYRNFPARVFLGIASTVITVTEATIPDIRGQVPGGKIITIPNGVDFEKFNAKTRLSELKEIRIAYIGRLDAYKGIGTLIEAFSIVKREFPGAKLEIIGRDEGIARSLKEVAELLGVEFTAREVEPEKMPGVYDSLSLVVLPSRYEGLSIVLLEAIASERPALATPVGAAPGLFAEVYKDEAKNMLFEVGNSAELARKIVRALKDKRMEGTCSSARTELMKKYSWDRVAKETIKAYGQALGK